jgi:uncharacterized protein
MGVRIIGQYAKKLAQRQSKPLKLHLTTNGTLFTKEILEWLIYDGWNVKVSLDGTIDIHNRFRKDSKGKGTFDKIEKHVRFLVEQIPNRFSTTSVFCTGTDPSKIFYGIAKLGVKRIEIVPVALQHPSVMILNENDFTAYRKFILDYSKQLAHGKKLPMLIRFIKRIRKVMGFGNNKVSCGAGRNFLAVAPDGKFYPCFRFIGLEDYQLGHIKSGIDQELVINFQNDAGRPYDLREKCKECWVAPLCGGPCFACAELLYHRNGEPSSDYCATVTADCEAALWLVQFLREKNPEMLIGFLGINVDDE